MAVDSNGKRTILIGHNGCYQEFHTFAPQKIKNTNFSWDVFAGKDYILKPNSVTLVKTGLKIHLEPGYYLHTCGKLYSKFSPSCHIAGHVFKASSDIGVCMVNVTETPVIVRAGDLIGEMTVLQCVRTKLKKKFLGELDLSVVEKDDGDGEGVTKHAYVSKRERRKRQHIMLEPDSSESESESTESETGDGEKSPAANIELEGVNEDNSSATKNTQGPPSAKKSKDDDEVIMIMYDAKPKAECELIETSGSEEEEDDDVPPYDSDDDDDEDTDEGHCSDFGFQGDPLSPDELHM